MSEPVLDAARRPARPILTGERTLEVLKGVDLDVYAGEIVGLIGPSGSGKSSLLHAAGLLEHPTAGQIVIDGRDCSKLNDAARSRVRLGPDRLRLPVPPPAAGVHRPRQRRPAADDRRRSRADGAAAGAARCSSISASASG